MFYVEVYMIQKFIFRITSHDLQPPGTKNYKKVGFFQKMARLF